MSKEVISKIIALWMPIFLFVALAYDHGILKPHLTDLALPLTEVLL